MYLWMGDLHVNYWWAGRKGDIIRQNYNIISLVYRIGLYGTPSGATFEQIVGIVDSYLKAYGSTLNFVAAFYITYVNARWWWLFMEIPWPDTLCMLISALMKSNGPASREKKRQIRLAVCGYWNLAFVLLMRDISVSTKKRFPSLDNLNPVLATKEEIQLLRKAADMLDGEDGGVYFQQSCLYSLPQLAVSSATWIGTP
uniref:Bestrophin homolog n=1 Tax=Ditylenchus dipsaci TaxID=166011 RepID=A0A915D6Z2_9BILA